MAARESVDILAADETLRLAEFARACKAAARVVALYPVTHPAIKAALGRIAGAAARLRHEGAVVLTVMPDAVLLDGRAPLKPESSLVELASLLHGHLIGELRLAGDLPPEGWHAFLTLLARAPEDVRATGGLSREWSAAGHDAIEVRQIDYTEVLRERPSGLDSAWERIITSYLEGDLSDLDEEAMTALLDIAGDTGRFKEFTEQLVAKASEGGRRGKKDIVLRVLQALADFTARQHPEQLDRVLSQVAGVVPRLTPDLVLMLITTGAPLPEGAPPGIDLGGEVRSRISDHAIAEFVAQTVSREQGATARLAEAFQALVPDDARRQPLLETAAAEAAHLPVGRHPDFREMWKHAVDMLTTYSDEKYVSDEYGRELASARANAIEVERVSDDPPERVNSWRQSVSEDAIRRAELRLLLDLLAIETRPAEWTQVLDAMLALIDQLVLTENLALAQELIEAIVAASREGQPFAATAHAGLEKLRTGPLMRHVVLFIRQAPADAVDSVSAFCRALGPSVIGTLAEALAHEQGLAMKRLREVLLSFGAAGRAYADDLRSSPNPAVRRTAIDLLRAFGGAEALPDLAGLLDDAEPAVQRDALRAIVQIGTDEAYAVLQQALMSSNTATRDAIMKALIATRDDRAAPLFVYILQHIDYRGHLEQVYLSAVETLGKLGGDPASVEALSRVLRRGEWWAPLRTQRLRTTAAAALRACGSAEARQALEQAVSDGPRGVRRAARAALNSPELSAAARRTA